jgi:hypothetical protein
MVSIAAFQAVDPGSIPGRRTSLFLPKIHFSTKNLFTSNTTGQGCRARLPGKAAGQGCRARLPGKSAGQECRARLHAMVQYAERMVKLDK